MLILDLIYYLFIAILAYIFLGDMILGIILTLPIAGFIIYAFYQIFVVGRPDKPSEEDDNLIHVTMKITYDDGKDDYLESDDEAIDDDDWHLDP